ncbi:NAD(P)/FAD-dependent oxidoreductase [Runella slithyformis]|uniref:FAD-dependent pyridine nucleotide-disulfide oxidoreductase n=1 Tax=Runella slithyformis (strain ATCC 29530 / DSM 19594 / LMG 11500 / NCIMB 11436 / LSU 4) TaxID=761193 RepID=A0A7U4E8T2_RUNSL|nr:pyridine nucleotide-disulfide oxidoreductase [Runella slithyformis]AEI51599.1 FAD-dependent pyridine nucleotide-disulfide oxidoreductase [Runella slithyformis DSM 19594]
MHQTLHLTLPPETALDESAFRQYIIQSLHLQDTDALTVRKLRQSIDARSRQIKVNVQADIYADELPPSVITYKKEYPDVSQKPIVVIVGCGPAGMFAALRLVELGYKPILLERGKDVRARRRDLAAINKDHVVHPDSNYCFGEGGAGTYSDGKLYTRSNKRGDVRRILEIMVAHGAAEEILYDAHPHIGTNKLPPLIADMRQSILNAGGEVHFETKVTDFIFSEKSTIDHRQSEIRGVVTADGREFTGIGVILATGHSARDIFELCQAKNVLIEAKPFAVGVRIEHSQKLIDSLQYHRPDRGAYLPAASYSLVTQSQHKNVQRGVFSFCMCPGGFIVPAATSPGELVVNGMSPSRRDSRFANSGMVVSIEDVDLKPYAAFGALAGLELQRVIEQKACSLAGGGQTAPAQRVLDFVKGKTSPELLDTSYQPGLLSMDLREYLPAHIAEPLRQGLQDFGRKMSGYVSNEAQLIGVESRTSSPVRIPRHRETAEHIYTQRLYPCGEGAGYAGGIMSAALDGTFVAEQLVNRYGK